LTSTKAGVSKLFGVPTATTGRRFDSIYCCLDAEGLEDFFLEAEGIEDFLFLFFGRG
jgi:hypothetical protein